MARLGLAQYGDRFEVDDIDLDVLRSPSEQDLEKLGVSMGHRRKLLKAIAELDGPPRSRVAADTMDVAPMPPKHLGDKILHSKSAGAGGVFYATGNQNSGVRLRAGGLAGVRLQLLRRSPRRHVDGARPDRSVRGRVRFRRLAQGSEATLVIDGKACGLVQVPFVMRMISSVGASVGYDHGGPMSLGYGGEFPFEGGRLGSYGLPPVPDLAHYRHVAALASVLLSALFSLTGLASLPAAVAAEPAATRPWTVRKANAWLKRTGWLVGSNYVPAYAVNQLEMWLEMWQPETFDPTAIDRELGLAQSLGFNSVRIFLHHLLWQQDSRGLLRRMEQFLAIAKAHGIGVMFVLLDGVWDPFPQAGLQRAPRPHVHNSGWVQSPGIEILGDPARHGELKGYIKGVIRHFRRDKRIQAWDLFNEPDNPNILSYGTVELPDKAARAHELLAKVFVWARNAKPTQPLTAGVWLGNWTDPAQLRPIESLMLESSDVISFHHYGGVADLQARVQQLRRYGRPILCTEFMARPIGSTFDHEPRPLWLDANAADLPLEALGTVIPMLEVALDGALVKILLGEVRDPLCRCGWMPRP